MPGQQQAPRRPERVLPGQRLLPADIDHRPRQVPFLQCLDQVSVDHRSAAPGIDEQRRGLEALEQCRVIQVVGCRGIRQQVEYVVNLTHQARQVGQRRYLDERRLLAGAAGNAIQHHAKRLQELGHPLANVASADDQHLAPFQGTPRAVVPTTLDLADQPRQHLALMAEHVGEHVLGHHLAKDAHGAGQAIVARQALGQQRGDTGPGGLHPARLVALAQQACQQVRLAQPHRALWRLACQFGGVAAGQDFQLRRGCAQDLGVSSMIMLSNQYSHDQAGSLRRSNSSGRCSM